MTGFDDHGDRRLDAWLDEPVPPPPDDLRRRVLEDVHGTPQRARWVAGLSIGGRNRHVPSIVGTVAALTVGLVFVVSVAPLVVPGPGRSSAPASAAPASDPRVVNLPGLPATLGADAAGALVGLRDGSIIRVRRDGTIATLGRLGVEPCGVPLGTADAIFVAGCDGRIHRIDVTSGSVSAFAGAGRQIAAGPGGGIWVLDATRRRAILADGASGALREAVDLNAFATGIVAGFGRVWVVGEGNARLTALDPTSGEILAVVDLGHEPTFGLAGTDVLYAVSASSRVLDVIDPVRGTAGDPVEGLPALATSVAMGPSGLWVGGSDGVLLLDPATSAVLERVPMPGTAWVAGNGSDAWALATGATMVTLLDED